MGGCVFPIPAGFGPGNPSSLSLSLSPSPFGVAQSSVAFPLSMRLSIHEISSVSHVSIGIPPPLFWVYFLLLANALLTRVLDLSYSSVSSER